MKKLVLAYALLVASATAGTAGALEECAVVLKASDGFWNVRATPNGKIVGRLHRGDTVTVDWTEGKWAYVIVHDSDVDGWVSSSGLQKYPCQ